MAKRIGDMLLDLKVISPKQLDEALNRQRRFGGRLATNVLAMGHADELTLARVLSLQSGVPFAVLSKSSIPLGLCSVLPLETARKFNALVVHQQGRGLVVALADPKNIAFLDELRFILGTKIMEHGALSGSLHDALEESYRLAGLPQARFWEGTALDGSYQSTPDGHVEIVFGKPEGQTENLPKPAEPELPAELDIDVRWVEDLAHDFPQPQPGKKSRILVVDDEPELRAMLIEFLQKVGYELWEAKDGTEALKILQTQLPDAVVLDAMLPGIHGFDICAQIKQSERTKHIVVIMVSAIYRGWRLADDVRNRFGADGFLEKPLKLNDLKHALETKLQGLAPSQGIQELERRTKELLLKAATAYRKGDLFGSAHLMEQAIRVTPFNSNLHYRLGRVYEQLGEHYRAMAELERAVELEPSYPHVFSLARIYQKNGFVNKAQDAFERCLRIAPDEKQARTIQGHLEQLGQH